MILKKEDRSLILYPPSHPEFGFHEQSSKCCSENATLVPYLIAYAPSRVATAENAVIKQNKKIK